MDYNQVISLNFEFVYVLGNCCYVYFLLSQYDKVI